MADLISIREAAERIVAGTPMLVAGDASQLIQLPKGQWIGGTTPYFMTRNGGVVDREHVFATALTEPVASTTVRIYPVDELQRLIEGYPDHGCNFIILPNGSATHLRFARECASWPGLFNSPLVGWNAGVLLGDATAPRPEVFDGTTLQSYDDAAAVLHATLRPDHVAQVEIVNAFRQGTGDIITFPRSGFLVTDCMINGQPDCFADYIARNAIDTRWPLVADYAGAQINVSFRDIEVSTKQVRLYAPVFEGIEYRLAEPMTNLADFFGKEFAARKVKPAFCCNCILNFLYAELEGKQTGTATGPITFGEIAYIQLNQTLVYVSLEQRV